MTDRIAVGALVTAFFLAMAPVESEAAKVGVASAVKNDVQRVAGGSSQPLATGSDLFTNERIRTGEASTAQILLLDKTSLTIGARSELTLDRFVYDPSNKNNGRVVLNAVQGAFRFITGSQNPGNYTIRTPIGTVGVRGTAGDVIVKPAGNLPAVQSNIASVTIVLIQGIMTFTFGNATYTLDVAGTAYTFFANGTVQGPQRWDGTIINTGSEVTHPLYGWYFQGEQPNNGLPNVQLGNIDQLNGLLQQTLKPPVGGGGGGGGDETFIPARRR